jgi:hypothetical protein
VEAFLAQHRLKGAALTAGDAGVSLLYDPEL